MTRAGLTVAALLAGGTSVANKQGTMSEEYLFWDNSTLMKQIGVGK